MGFTKMAIGASLGGPLFNLAIGVGVSMTVNTIPDVNPFPLPSSGHISLSVIFISVACVAHLFVMLWRDWRLPKVYGWILLGSYALYLVLNVLIFTGDLPLE